MISQFLSITWKLINFTVLVRLLPITSTLDITRYDCLCMPVVPPLEHSVKIHYDHLLHCVIIHIKVNNGQNTNINLKDLGYEHPNKVAHYVG